MFNPLFLVLVVVTQAPASKVEWKTFTSPKGKFAVSMPGKPSEKKRILAVTGTTADLVIATGRKGQAVYTAAYAVLKGVKPDAAMKSAQDDLVAQSKGEVKDEKDVKLGEVNGKEITIDIPGKVMAGGGACTVRIFVVKDRVFALSATVPTAKAEDLAEDVTSFFDSFKPEGLKLADSDAKEESEKEPSAAPKAATAKTTTKKAESTKAETAKAGTGKAMASKSTASKSATSKSKAASKKASENSDVGDSASTTAAPPKAIPEFSPPDRSYVVKMPGKPGEKSENRGSMMGGPIETKIYFVTSGNAIFSVSSERAEGHNVADAASADRNLGIQKKIKAKIRKYTIKSEKRLTLGEAPGLEVLFDVPVNDQDYPLGAQILERMFIVGTTQYSVSVALPKGSEVSQAALDFLDSFEVVLPGGKRTGRAVPKDLKWALYTPPTSEFTILMPGKPVFNIRKSLNRGGETKSSEYLAEVGELEFSVEIIDLGGSLVGESGKSLLKSLSETERNLVGGSELKSSKEIAVGGKPGREEILEMTRPSETKPVTKIRQWILDAPKGRIYVVGVVGPTGCDKEKVVQDFLKSMNVN